MPVQNFRLIAGTLEYIFADRKNYLLLKEFEYFQTR